MPRGIPNRQSADGKTMTKMEAVRRALAALGREAKPTQIREWVKSNLRMDMEPNNISAYKTMIRAESAGRSRGASGGSGISKMEAVRRAVDTLGKKAKPQEILSFIKSNFQVKMEPTLISNYKSSLYRKGAGRSRVIRKPARAAAPSAAPSEAAPSGFSIDEIQQVKQVVEKIGADKVQQLAKVLAR